MSNYLVSSFARKPQHHLAIDLIFRTSQGHKVYIARTVLHCERQSAGQGAWCQQRTNNGKSSTFANIAKETVFLGKFPIIGVFEKLRLCVSFKSRHISVGEGVVRDLEYIIFA